MSIEKVYAVYDTGVEYYSPPIVMKNNGEALRWFKDSVNNFESKYYAHPECYALFELGSYDICNGIFNLLEAKKSLILGNECIDEDARKLCVDVYSKRVGAFSGK